MTVNCENLKIDQKETDFDEYENQKRAEIDDSKNYLGEQNVL